jgi:hypothetical protein
MTSGPAPPRKTAPAAPAIAAAFVAGGPAGSLDAGRI